MSSTAATPNTPDSRVFIVTGASSGIGAELAKQAASKGWRVVAVARRADRLNSLVDSIRRSGGTAIAVVADITTKDAPQQIVSTAMQAFSRIDVVVSSAGYAMPGELLNQTDAQIETQWQLHVAAPLRLARAALPHVEKIHGGFVFFGSGLARVPSPQYGAYAAAKAAVRAAAIQLRRELRSRNVFVTYIDPGVVDTEFSVASGFGANDAWWHGKPAVVARRILRGIERRASRVNASPWQTAGTVFAEWFPGIADAAMAGFVKMPEAVPTPPTATPVPANQPVAADVTQVEEAHDPFEAALEPVARRMERVKLSPSFVRGLLSPGTTIELNDAAMRWAGMPNKNERAAMHEVLAALEESGYLQPEGDDTWKVLRGPE